MKTQTELTQPGGEISPQPPGILFILEADHKVIAVSHKDNAASGLRLPPLLDPEIEHIVQEDVGQQGADARSLGSSFYRLPPLTALQNAGPEPLPYQSEYPGSAILWATIRNNHSWFTESKNLRMSASSTQFT
jgi:hypothetical protein